MKRQKRKVALVAGGAGFIGSHLCDRLIGAGSEVICIDNLETGDLANLRHLESTERFDFVEVDVIRNLPKSIRDRQFTHVYNLACAASPPHYQADPEHTMLSNVIGTSNLLRLAEKCGARFLLASTSEVYGDPKAHPQREDYRGWVNCTGPRACYDEGKRAAETLAFDFFRHGRAEVRVMRIFNTYGPRMRPDDGRVISNVICQALSGEPITVYGDGSQTRSFCYVDDLVDGLERLMEYRGPQPGPVNLGNPNELTVSDLVDRVLKMTGSTSPVVHRELPEDDPHRRRPDVSKAKALLDWEPKVALEQGLEATARYFASVIDSGERPLMNWANTAPDLVAAE